MKILMLAWRDVNNPRMGGAEIVTDIYLKGLKKLGHEVTLFTADYSNSHDIKDYKVIRKGNQMSVYFHGLKYAKSNEENYDIIIDQVNTIPFFTPLVINKKKRAAFFHQLCKDIWFYETRFPVSAFGYILESIYLKLYNNTRAFVVSDSTKKDLIKHSWARSENVLVLPNQIDFKPLTKLSKKRDHFVFVGRIAKSKRIHDCIKALALTKGNTRLYIVGQGEEKYLSYLKNLAKKLGLEKRVVFTGKVTERERNELMSKALAILVTSVREGWGLIVSEANANGTLAITYDVPGLVDANKTGFITKENTPESLANYMSLVIEDKKVLREKSLDSLNFVKGYTNWDDNVRRLERWLKN